MLKAQTLKLRNSKQSKQQLHDNETLITDKIVNSVFQNGEGIPKKKKNKFLHSSSKNPVNHHLEFFRAFPSYKNLKLKKFMDSEQKVKMAEKAFDNCISKVIVSKKEIKRQQKKRLTAS